ncbi:MAG: sigma 54-interacting transcriptional regulator [Sedimentisphaerales bacterium]|nr:sigma 54-interacting transcriptional regulator [Sedimentisphaerales bacterium]
MMQAAVHQSILRSLSEAVCSVDPQWRIQCFNREAELLTGISGQDAVGRLLNEVFSADVGEVHVMIATAMKSGKTISGTRTHIVNGRGETIPVIVNAAPVLDGARTVTGAVLVLQDNRVVEVLRRQLRREYTCYGIVSRDARIERILHMLPSVADSSATVLITGPTGTGKELLARAIHSASRRRTKPFLAINCGALPDTLLESELFGYKKGAFTDAKKDKRGRFALAEGGTLLLDEIGDVSPAMQVKLLRVLEERQYEPLGGTASVRADVRIVATSNRDVAAMVESGTFRSDLYYRLNVVEFHLPPLAERTGDIPFLLEHFIEVLNAETGRTVDRVSRAAMHRLMTYPYPGNVRELRNIVEHAYAICGGDEISDACLPTRLFGVAALPERQVGSAAAAAPLHRMPDEKQRQLITQVLHACKGHRRKTAEALQIDKSTLWRKMKALGIEYPER